MVPIISIAICTHNPRAEYLNKVLEGILNQSSLHLIKECVLVDNGSTHTIALEPRVSQSGMVRVVREDRLGLAHARLRAFRETSGDILVFADDDTVFSPDYIEKCMEIHRDHPHLGIWGAGVIHGVYEVQPVDWIRENQHYLTVHQIGKDRWGNMPDLSLFPAGAGIVMRRKACQKYFETFTLHPIRSGMGRTGTSLASCEDMDICWSAVDEGWGVGRFVNLSLDHHIPKGRVQEDYFLRLVENQWRSNLWLKFVHGVDVGRRNHSWLTRFRVWRYERGLSPAKKAIAQATRRGCEKALEDIESYKDSGSWQPANA